ncbi:MAG TPA: hypothetical protein PKM73_15620 [Verrucomicrobiota bacterium]|nr:hypothetical protein [Verrucomicrobiota bacterium]HNU52282.1 hypothetical protein [Verrucomicrobiota bacterium]
MTPFASFAAYAGELEPLIRADRGPEPHPLLAETEFNRLALGLFALQYPATGPLRRLADARRLTPDCLRNWRDLPAIPTEAFRDWEVTSLPTTERTAVFHSSGTTGLIASRHFHSRDSLRVYEDSVLGGFALRVLGGMPSPHTILSLTPPPEQAPQSSLVHMLATVIRTWGTPSSAFLGEITATGDWRWDGPRIRASLARAADNSKPVSLLGTAIAFVRLLEELDGRTLPLPPGSRLMETGGYKGRTQSIPREELHRRLEAALALPATHIVAEYGMTELSSQAYDLTVPPLESSTSGRPGRLVESQRLLFQANPPSVEDSIRRFHFAPWARARVISPETGTEVPDGGIGCLRVVDLANIRSALAVQTADLARRLGDGFELLGRAAQAEPRGCSLAAG